MSPREATAAAKRRDDAIIIIILIVRQRHGGNSAPLPLPKQHHEARPDNMFNRRRSCCYLHKQLLLGIRSTSCYTVKKEGGDVTYSSSVENYIATAFITYSLIIICFFLERRVRLHHITTSSSSKHRSSIIKTNIIIPIIRTRICNTRLIRTEYIALGQ
jgi:hypothetical protein